MVRKAVSFESSLPSSRCKRDTKMVQERKRYSSITKVGACKKSKEQTLTVDFTSMFA